MDGLVVLLVLGIIAVIRNYRKVPTCVTDPDYYEYKKRQKLKAVRRGIKKENAQIK